nr:MAG TPA: hypothetical protein [Caudoviricetes sp.]
MNNPPELRPVLHSGQSGIHRRSAAVLPSFSPSCNTTFQIM